MVVKGTSLGILHQETHEAALKREAETEAQAIRVNIQDDKVDFEGKVEAWPECYRACRLVVAGPRIWTRRFL